MNVVRYWTPTRRCVVINVYIYICLKETKTRSINRRRTKAPDNSGARRTRNIFQQTEQCVLLFVSHVPFSWASSSACCVMLRCYGIVQQVRYGFRPVPSTVFLKQLRHLSQLLFTENHEHGNRSENESNKRTRVYLIELLILWRLFDEMT